MAPDELIVREGLYNWLGFGNPNGKYWFIGREESIALSQCSAVDSWMEYFETRNEFPAATDFRSTWEDAFGRPLSTFSSTTTWHYQAAFLLAFRGMNISSSKVKELIFEDPQFGRMFSNHFTGEFFPCPKSSKDTIEPYGHIWDSPEAYQSEVGPGRIERFCELLERNPDVDWIISYSPTLVSTLCEEYPTTAIDVWEDLAMDPFVLYQLAVGPERTVNLLETPFLGYGRVGYDAIEQVVKELRSVV